MMPAVPVPRGAKVARAVDVKLKAGWRFDPKRGVFTSERGETFTVGRAVPRSARIVPKVPSLARAAPARLSKAERELRRYVQVLLPPRADPARYVEAIRSWPSVEDARPSPAVSLPTL